LRKLPNATFCARTVIDGDTTIEGRRPHEARKHERYTSWAIGCGGCSSIVPDSLFEFHHWDARERNFGISRDGTTRPWEAITDELLKCVMSCANCHREVHAGVRQNERESGAIVASTAVRGVAAA
jgi:hypothetical protein